MARIKIKTNTKGENRKLALLGILSKKDIYLTRLIQSNDGYVAITASDNDSDRVFNNSTDSELREQDFIPQIPPQLKANRSILLTRVDKHIDNNEEEEILREIEAKK